jgi:hypothetical protein
LAQARRKPLDQALEPMHARVTALAPRREDIGRSVFPVVRQHLRPFALIAFIAATAGAEQSSSRLEDWRARNVDHPTRARRGKR